MVLVLAYLDSRVVHGLDKVSGVDGGGADGVCSTQPEYAQRRTLICGTADLIHPEKGTGKICVTNRMCAHYSWVLTCIP